MIKQLAITLLLGATFTQTTNSDNSIHQKLKAQLQKLKSFRKKKYSATTKAVETSSFTTPKEYHGFPHTPVTPAYCHYGDKLFVYGGLIDGYLPSEVSMETLNKIWIFSYKTKGWNTITFPYEYREGHSLTVTEDKIIIFGGRKMNPHNPSEYKLPYSNELFVYDMQDQTWNKSKKGSPRGGHTATYLNGKIYIWGGTYTKDIDSAFPHPSTYEPRPLEIYSPKNGAMTTLQEYTSFLSGHKAAIHGDTLYFVGGATPREKAPEPSATITWYNVKSGDVDTLRTPVKVWGQMAAVKNNNLIVFGGHSSKSQEGETIVLSYHLTNNQWKQTSLEKVYKGHGNIGGGVYNDSLFVHASEYGNSSKVYRYNLNELLSNLR